MLSQFFSVLGVLTQSVQKNGKQTIKSAVVSSRNLTESLCLYTVIIFALSLTAIVMHELEVKAHIASK